MVLIYTHTNTHTFPLHRKLVPNTLWTSASHSIWINLKKWSSISNPTSKAFWVCALWIILWVDWPLQTEGHSMSHHIWQLCWDLEVSSRLNWLKFHLSLFYISLFSSLPHSLLFPSGGLCPAFVHLYLEQYWTCKAHTYCTAALKQYIYCLKHYNIKTHLTWMLECNYRVFWVVFYGIFCLFYRKSYVWSL